MFKDLRQLFSGAKNRNELIFLIYTCIHGAFFADGNWIFLYLLYMTYGQIGIVDSIAFGIGLLLEIPTGAIADLLGRKITVQISSFLIMTGLLMQGLGLNSWILLFGNVIFFIGMAFYSGSGDALIYDTMKEQGRLDKYESLITASRSARSISYILAVLIGGLAASVNVRWPWLLWAAVHGIGFILSFFLKEPKIEKISFSLSGYFKQNWLGFKQLFLPKLKPFIAFIFLILGVNYAYDWGYIKPAVCISFGLDSIAMSVLFASGALLSAFLIMLLPKLRRILGDYRGMVLINTVSIISVFLLSQQIGYWGIIPIVLMELINNFGNIWITIIINKYVPSQFRATALSTVAMFLKIPYVLTAFMIGGLIDKGFLKPMLLWLAVGLVVVSLIEFFLTRRSAPENKMQTG